jgi:hypothetical protein
MMKHVQNQTIGIENNSKILGSKTKPSLDRLRSPLLEEGESWSKNNYII